MEIGCAPWQLVGRVRYGWGECVCVCVCVCVRERERERLVVREI